MKRIFYLLTTFLLIPILAFAQTEEITLQEAIDIALENNYQLKQAQNNLDLAETEIFSAKADFFPSVSGSFGGTRRIGQQFDQTTVQFEDLITNTMSGSLSSSTTLFNGFRNILNLNSTQASHSSQQESLERLRETIIFNTASRYLQVVLDQELLRIAESTLEASQSQLEQIQAQVEVGALPTVDLYNQEATVANDELQVVQSENALEFSMVQLLRIMQDDAIQEIEIDMPSTDKLNLIPTDLNLQEMVDAAIQNRSDLRAQEFAIESNRNEVKIARGNLLPSISANIGINGSYNDQFRNRFPDPNDPGSFISETVSFTSQFLDQNVNKFFGFSMQIPIFDNWTRRTTLQSTKIQLKNSRLEKENIRFQISEEIRQAYNDYVSISKELESTQKALNAAERAFETEEQRYEVGANTLIELNQANANYVQAQSNRVQAIYNFVFQEKLLDYYIGRLTEDVEF